MVRTQIYLTEKERADLAALAGVTGKSQSELIREAVDGLIDRSGGARRAEVLKETAGLWKGRKDLPDFRSLRGEWDRSGSGG